MAGRSSIEWTESTWNPVTGCTKISAGCKNCYAERMAKRLKAMGNPRYVNGFKPTAHPDVLACPLSWKKPRMIFVNSMSDLFHEDVPSDFVTKVFEVMRKAHWHVFQVLTKRGGRLAELSSALPWPANVWMGVTVEAEDYLDRIDCLRITGPQTRFLSLEPLLGPFRRLDLHGIDWVIVGGESGPGARPMKPKWVRSIRDQCLRASVPFFFKQWGGTFRRRAGRILDGRTWDETPTPAPSAVSAPGARATGR